MPYVSRDRRNIDSKNVASPGELNYLITKLLIDYIGLHRGVAFNYTSINDVLGALEGAKLEFYRRVVVPYENKKIEENSDVY